VVIKVEGGIDAIVVRCLIDNRDKIVFDRDLRVVMVGDGNKNIHFDACSLWKLRCDLEMLADGSSGGYIMDCQKNQRNFIIFDQDINGKGMRIRVFNGSEMVYPVIFVPSEEVMSLAKLLEVVVENVS